MKKDKSMPPPAQPLSKEAFTIKVKEFPLNYGATIVGITCGWRITNHAALGISKSPLQSDFRV